MRRQGVATIWALVVLAVLTVFSTTVTWQILASRRWLDRRQAQLQASWMARSGIELAAARLLTEPGSYKGETLEILPGSRVRITVQPGKSPPDTYLVSSEAMVSVDGAASIVRSEERRLRRHVDKDRARLEFVPPAPQSE